MNKPRVQNCLDDLPYILGFHFFWGRPPHTEYMKGSAIEFKDITFMLGLKCLKVLGLCHSVCDQTICAGNMDIIKRSHYIA